MCGEPRESVVCSELHQSGYPTTPYHSKFGTQRLTQEVNDHANDTIVSRDPVPLSREDLKLSEALEFMVFHP